MKSRFLLFPALIVTFANLATLLHADVETVKEVDTTKTPTTSVTEETSRTSVVPDPSITRVDGKVDRIDKESGKLMVRTKYAKEPIGYVCNEKTVILDLDGKKVDSALLVRDVPVEVNCVEATDGLIATKVVVQRVQAPLPGGGMTLTARDTRRPEGVVIEESTKTTVVDMGGTLQAMDPEFVALTIEGSDQPVRFQVTKATAWVNADGEAVVMETVKTGVPVSVQYTKKGEAMFAEQIIISPIAVPAPGPAPGPAVDPAPKSE